MLIEVTKDEFFKAMNINVHPRIVADGSDFETPDRRLIGRIIGNDGHYYDAQKKYFLVKA